MSAGIEGLVTRLAKVVDIPSAEDFIGELRRHQRSCGNHSSALNDSIALLAEATVLPGLSMRATYLLAALPAPGGSVNEALLRLFRGWTTRCEDEPPEDPVLIQRLVEEVMRRVASTRLESKQLKMISKLIELHLSLAPMRDISVEETPAMDLVRALLAAGEHHGALQLYRVLMSRSSVLDHRTSLCEFFLDAEDYRCFRDTCLLSDGSSTKGDFIDFLVPVLERCIARGSKQSLEAAADVGAVFGLSEFAGQARRALRQLKVRGLVKTGKWQMALRMCLYDDSAKRLLFDSLLAERLFLEASEVRTQLRMETLVEPVPETSLRLQALFNAAEYLSLPAGVDVVLVESEDSLQQAAQRILGGDDSSDTDQPPTRHISQRIFALDCEWRPGSEQASILQVACLERVFLFDLWHLSRDASTIEHVNRLLSALFNSPHLIKLGFAFNENDLRLLRNSHNGSFTFASTLTSFVEMSKTNLNSLITPFQLACNGVSVSLSSLW